ncbi:MAG TPA: hypothetical protein DEP42_04920 [Ruminococcaceae bacterium]|nr:hypothetical protein [Oscillospiraceae bacterium]
MKTLTLKLGKKIYTASLITMRLSREAMKIQADTVELATKAKKLQDMQPSQLNEETQELDPEFLQDAQEVLNKLDELSIRKLNLICETYKEKFTVDELENNLTKEEVDEQAQQIFAGVTGILSKN